MCFLHSLSKQTRLPWTVEAAENSEDLRDISQKILRLFTEILERSGYYSSEFLVIPQVLHMLLSEIQNDVTCHRVEYKTTLPRKHCPQKLHRQFATIPSSQILLQKITHHTFLSF